MKIMSAKPIREVEVVQPRHGPNWEIVFDDHPPQGII
jgi:hypothetical protein